MVKKLGFEEGLKGRAVTAQGETLGKRSNQDEPEVLRTDLKGDVGSRVSDVGSVEPFRS